MKSLTLAACIALWSLFSTPAVALGHGSAIASGSETYTARGVIRSFGESRRSVNIAHEAIPGYMGAMTMSFEASTADQLATFAVSDRVRFTFTATDDGRRILKTIAKVTP